MTIREMIDAVLEAIRWADSDERQALREELARLRQMEAEQANA